jgi:hypothetical protein
MELKLNVRSWNIVWNEINMTELEMKARLS